ncbi:SMI1/KNR4 family protein [Stieleria sp. JC731]|uniref:SMI1/KNR4 family protein n=1 Tax=Stieleria sp. JC731 TaxID=2894195 RepID=UPI001E34A8EA|nr:SMI1/KNR4 family protein [Stieleria sp. JC731]MCC9602244.1 SMI1/KNR4 family protein [Stieleria sp. JC731]
MEQTDIDRIESTLGIKIPERHAQFLKNYSFQEPQDFLMVDAETMIFENDNPDWDSNFLIVGNDGCGNPLCLRLSPPSNELWICEFDPPDGFSVHMTCEELEEIYGRFESNA